MSRSMLIPNWNDLASRETDLQQLSDGRVLITTYSRALAPAMIVAISALAANSIVTIVVFVALPAPFRAAAVGLSGLLNSVLLFAILRIREPFRRGRIVGVCEVGPQTTVQSEKVAGVGPDLK